MKRKVRRKVEVVSFDAAEFLDSDAKIAAYLDAALGDSNPDVFLLALGAVVRAKGVAAIAEKAGVGRESLYKTLAPGATPRYETIHKLVEALGVRLSVAA